MKNSTLQTVRQLPDNYQDSGVHLDEPSSTFTSSYSDKQLDGFVHQMMSPNEKSSKVTGEENADSNFQAYDIDSENSKDGSKHSKFLHDFKDKCSLKNSSVKGKDRNSAESKVEKRSPDKRAKKMSRQPRLRSINISDEDEAVEVSFESVDESEEYDIKEIPIECDVPSEERKVVFRCDFPREDSGSEQTFKQVPGSDEQLDTDKTKKRRFPKLLSPSGNLHRSQSATTSAEIPSHASFLRSDDSLKDLDSMESRASAYESSYKELLREARAGQVRKTISADAAMMATEEKSRSKNIARKVTKKLKFLRRRNTDSVISEGSTGKIWKDGHPRYEDIKKWSESFEQLLSDKSGIELFRGFLRSEFSEENIEFWVGCEQFKTCRPDQMSMLAEQIYSDFVALKSTKEVNLDSKTRLDIIANINQPTREIFDRAQKRIQALMEKDSYQRFLKSDIYVQLLATHTGS